jgi:hypothetical protein
LVKSQATLAVFPAFVELAPAPNVPIEVAAVVLAVTDPVAAVPGAETVFV